VTADLTTVLADYRTGLDAELQLLSQLDALASRQRALPHPPEAEALASIGVERERHLGALLALEQQLLPLRQAIASRLTEARALPGFDGVAERHRRAGEIVTRIMALDSESLQALQRADQDRRAAAQSLEAGEATLAAYRRILQQQQPSAGLFTQRG
jgi:hypothetical protein